ncbi:AMP-binding protein [Cohaesibacter celericrescens]|uniref:Long-chain-fatty-acid--CoA ligase n=1 Tax=Cohaesibacter celericrescens TaxID=2067669 RepID=A0A2N5XTR4_9HYPH|nr:AMP-binding protein [Cohaesibacter celericrescens]PLW77916.1 long-chain fatty acid--CoA ligase [Cohaesibacter celericrescens]
MTAILPELNPQGFRTIPEILDYATATYGPHTAFSALGAKLSFQDLDRKTAAFAAYLQQAGLMAGDRIAIQLPNLLQSPIAVLGAIRAGLVVVNTNPLYTATELRHQLIDSGAKAMVVISNVAHTASKVVPHTDVGLVIVTEVGDMHSLLKRKLINFVSKRVKKLVPKFRFANQVTFRTALRVGARARAVKHSAQSSDTAVLQYTGGTTGPARAAILSHSNLVANMAQVRYHLAEATGQPGDIWVAPLPLYHIFAFTAHNLVFLSRGCHSLLIPNPRDMNSFAKALKGKKFHGFLQINTLMVALVQNKAFRKLDFSSLKITVSGGAALTMDAAAKWQALTGGVVSESYGMSETSPGITGNIIGKEQLGSIGVAFHSTNIRVVDEHGHDVPDGEPGELWVQGPQVMQGYWNAPEETQNVLTKDGWLKSGDIVVRGNDAAYRIVDRKKDIVNVSGFNVAPNEVENVVSQMSEIAECAVIGIPDDKTGEALCLYVVGKNENEAPTKMEIIKHCQQHLTSYKLPKQIHYVETLPKNAIGKVLRRELRSKHKSECDQTPRQS